MVLSNGKPQTVSDFVGSLQNNFKGQDFNSLAFQGTNEGLEVVPSAYQPADNGYYGEPRFFGSKAIFFTCSSPLPARVEHLLRLVRQFYSGVGFQFLKIVYANGELRITK